MNLALVNARLIDPTTDYDGPGSVVIGDGIITQVIKGETPPEGSAQIRVIDCDEKVLIPGLIDLRVRCGTDTLAGLKDACIAAVAGGVTSIVIQPDTDPIADNGLVIEAITGRGRDLGLARVYVAGAASPGLRGDALPEIGLMLDAGAVLFAQGDTPITDARLMRNLLTYAGGFNALVAHRPYEPALGSKPIVHEGDLAMRMGLIGIPAMAERIGLERDVALAELTGARLLIDQISAKDSLEPIRRAKARGLEVLASVSVNHLVFNEIDLSDYRKPYLFDPPLRTEDDRTALCDALEEGLIDIVVSNHTPLAPEDRMGLFAEAKPGAVGLQTLLPALIGLHHDRDIPLLNLIAAVTLNPAQALGLPQGRLSVGAPADLTLIDIDAPFALREKDMIGKSKNTPFENRTLTGKVRLTVTNGRIVFSTPL
jgi:dihydroorotase